MLDFKLLYVRRYVYWHLNDRFVGRTNNEHEFNKALESGDYRLSVIDQFGQKEALTFTVL